MTLANPQSQLYARVLEDVTWRWCEVLHQECGSVLVRFGTTQTWVAVKDVRFAGPDDGGGDLPADPEPEE